MGGAHLQQSQVYDYGATMNEEDAVAAIHHAGLAGINLIDTSPLYWDSESVVGRALVGRRDQFIISTKIGQFQGYHDDTFDNTWRVLETSLQRLGCDQVDILFLHSLQDDQPWSSLLAPDKIVPALIRARDQRLARYLGVSGWRTEPLVEAMSSGIFDVAMSYYEYNLLRLDGLGVVGAAERLGMGLINAGPLVGGLLNGDDPDQMEPRRRDRLRPGEAERIRHWRALCREYDYPLPALNLRFSVGTAPFASTVIGMRNVAEVDAAVSAVAESVPGELRAEVERWRAGAAGLKNPG